MTISLTNLKIGGVAGESAFLPNQPILQGCLVADSVDTTIKTGAIVDLATGGLKEGIVVKPATTTAEPFGVVVFNAIKTGFKAKERISVFPAGSYVKLPAKDADIERGDVLYFDANSAVTGTDPVGEGTYGIIGVAMTEPSAIGDLVVVKIAPATKTIAG